MKKNIKVLVFLLFSVAIVGIIAPVNGEIIAKADEKDVKIESKMKTINYKVTFNANGGKIDTKETRSFTVKKGSKIGKLPKTPKLSGYTFKGWFTKKNGGTKITKNFKPSKKITFYAQWKSSRVLNSEEKKFVGSYAYGKLPSGYWTYHSYDYQKWVNTNLYVESYEFKVDGTFKQIQITDQDGGTFIVTTGNWQIPVKGTLSLTNRIEDSSQAGIQKHVKKINNAQYNIQFTEQDGEKGITGFYGLNWFYKKY